MSTPIGDKLFQNVPRRVEKFRENPPRDVEKFMDAMSAINVSIPNLSIPSSGVATSVSKLLHPYTLLY